MVQIVRPTTDTTRDNWEEDDGTTVNIFDQIDEAVADNTDYIRTGLSPTSDVYVTKLGSLTDPVASSGHIVRYRIGKDTAAGEQIDFVVQLRQAYTNEGAPGTLIAAWEHLNVDASLATVAQTLTDAEANSISDYANLYLRFVANETTPIVVPGPLRTVNVATTSQLVAALADALPGDRIVMAAGTYGGSTGFSLARSGTATHPIVLYGPRTAIVTAGQWLAVSGSYWWVQGFRISGTGKGVFQTSTVGHNIYDSLEIDHTNTEGIILHASSTDNEIAYCYIHDTGVAQPLYGEGIYISDSHDTARVLRTWVHHNTITNVTSEGIELKPGGNESIVEFNTITNAGTAGIVGGRNPIQIYSNNNQIRDNTITTWTGPTAIGTGTGGAGILTQANNNTYRRNQATNSAGGTLFSFESGHTGNVVCSDNVAVAPVTMGVATTTCA